MSMIGNLRTLRDEEGALLLANPTFVRSFLYGETIPQKKDSFWQRLSKSSQPTTQRFEPAAEGAEIDIDKAWHGIHYLLTGNSWVAKDGSSSLLGFLVSGGSEIGDVDVGYGPARLFKSDEVATLASALSPLGRADLSQRYVVADLVAAEIYPMIWDDPEDDALEYLLTYFELLRSFVLKAQEDRKALLFYIN
jgi:hypothetical protein